MAKSEIEIKFDKMLKEYKNKFGQPYPCMITDISSLKSHIQAMEQAIKSGKMVPEPEYKKGAKY